MCVDDQPKIVAVVRFKSLEFDTDDQMAVISPTRPGKATGVCE